MQCDTMISVSLDKMYDIKEEIKEQTNDTYSSNISSMHGLIVYNIIQSKDIRNRFVETVMA